MNVTEMTNHLNSIGYDISGMDFEEIDELAEAEGYYWSQETNLYEYKNI